jgi:Ca-activated chloride channel family protein
MFLFLHFYGLRNLKGRSIHFANFEAISRIKGIDFYSKGIFTLILNVLIVILIILGISGANIVLLMDASKYSYILAIDSSESMTARDIEPTRLEASKKSAIEFVRVLPYESFVGIVSFSGDSRIIKDLTKDKIILENSINTIEISNTSGTDIYEAIVNSIRLLDDKNYKSVILLSDGQMNVGNVDEIIDHANKKGAIIHALGIGTVAGGETNFGFSKIDENILKSLSYNTGGKYFQITNNENFKKSFDKIIEVTSKKSYISLVPYFLMVLLILLILKQYLISTNRILY